MVGFSDPWACVSSGPSVSSRVVTPPLLCIRGSPQVIPRSGGDLWDTSVLANHTRPKLGCVSRSSLNCFLGRFLPSKIQAWAHLLWPVKVQSRPGTSCLCLPILYRTATSAVSGHRHAVVESLQPIQSLLSENVRRVTLLNADEISGGAKFSPLHATYILAFH